MGTTYTVSSGNCPSFSHALPALRFSCLLQDRGTSFQDGVSAGEGFLCAPFWGVQICDYSAANGDNNLLPWPPQSPDLTPCDFFHWGLLKTVYVTIAHAHPGTSWLDTACIADHYSRHATLSLGWVWLPCGCVSCDPRCTYWRTVINASETWTVPAADIVCLANVGWEIHFLIHFKTAPFFVYALYYLVLWVL
jgi:hypothetical protein